MKQGTVCKPEKEKNCFFIWLRSSYDKSPWQILLLSFFKYYVSRKRNYFLNICRSSFPNTRLTLNQRNGLALEASAADRLTQRNSLSLEATSRLTSSGNQRKSLALEPNTPGLAQQRNSVALDNLQRAVGQGPLDNLQRAGVQGPLDNQLWVGYSPRNAAHTLERNR